MFVALLVLLAVVACPTNGHPLEVKPHPYSKFFHNSRIVGGEEAPEGSGKHMAALLYGYRWVSFICGGSIISARHILTAAHCIDTMLTWNGQLVREFRGIIGTNKWLTGTNQVEFSGFVIHPGWDWDTIKNDIGLLTVSRNIQSSDTVSTIPLNFDFVEGGVRAYVTGWGINTDSYDLPEKLQKLAVLTLSYEDCKERIRQIAEIEGPMPPIHRDVEICTLHSVGHGMCNGDSGSALILESVFQQVGIVSWGVPCATGAPDVFARLSGFKDFIYRNTNGYLE